MHTQNHTPAFLKLAAIKADRDAAHGRFMAHRAEVESLQVARKRIETEIAHLDRVLTYAPPVMLGGWNLSREEADRVVKQNLLVQQEMRAKRDAERSAIEAMFADLDAGIEAARAREAAAGRDLADHNRLAETAEKAFTEIAGRGHIFAGL
ncbi:MAG: hypothetical protein PWP11_1198 [Thauera sp.]|nr:hypothetical protein [Thauera sp.]MDI3489921.1 hypothetical protein [Thauera sp.]